MAALLARHEAAIHVGLMSFRAVFLSLLALLPASAGLARERTEEKTFALSGPPTVRLSAYRGSIAVESSEENVVRVKVTANTTLDQAEAAERALGALQLDWAQEGNTFTLKATNRAETGVRFFWQDGAQLDISVTITVPRVCALNLSVDDGSIRIGDVNGTVHAKTEAGLVFCRHVDGALTVQNGRGDIIVSACTGDVDLTATRGIIRTGPIGGMAKVTATNGDIELLSVSGGLEAKADGGEVTVGIPKVFVGKASIKAAGGDVNLKIDPAANVDVSASSVWGQVRLVPVGRQVLPLVTESGGQGRHALVGRLNAGGIVIEARANGGHVNLTSEVPPFS
jgi:DUF4097 and DUF4098 domain-containing protein YvlB